MGMQGADIQRDFLKHLLKGEGRSPLFAQWVFFGVGVVLTLSAFFILQSFVKGLSSQEQGRVSQHFVEGVVDDFADLVKPLDELSDLISLRGVPDAQSLQTIVKERTDEYRYFSHIFWFYKNQEGAWSVARLHKAQDTPIQFDADGALLKSLLGQEVLGFAEARLMDAGKKLEVRQHRNVPKIASMPFILAQSVEVRISNGGFLIGVLDLSNFYDDLWIKGHKDLSFVKISDLAANAPVFEFDRLKEGVLPSAQIYEFPFAGRTLEISAGFELDQRSKFLNVFPYIVGLFGFLLSAAGMFYIRHSHRQAHLLADMNEALEQKNFELKVEAEERERLNKAIQSAEKSSRAVIDAVSDIIFEVDKTGNIIFLNKAWKEVTGFEVEQTMGQHLSQVIHPQEKEQFSRDLTNLLDGQKNEIQCFTQIRVTDGTFKAVEMSMSVISRASEAETRVIGTFSDIEERRKVERALSDAEKKYRSIVENAAGGIFQLTPEGLYLSANPAFARILGYEKPEQLLREVKNANEQLYVDPVQRENLYRKLCERPDAITHEIQMRNRDGDVIWVHESIRAVMDDAGQLLFVEGSIEDVTQRKEAEVTIREAKIHSDLANRAKSEFLSNMSHELRTPLNSIIGFSEMIKNEIYGQIEQRQYWEYARDIHDSGSKLLRVINEILDISKIEAGNRQLNEGIVDLKDVIGNAIELLDVKIEKSDLTITKALDSLPQIVGEELALKQVMMNLLSNAVKFTPAQGRITISGHVGRDGDVHVSITDTGIGLDEYEIEKALSPFGQLESELSRSGSGTGLGLTLVDALVKLHGGRFELFSQKGIGTTATIILPGERIVRSKDKDTPAAAPKIEDA